MKKMARALEAVKEHLTCPLCKNNFEDPKTLVCLHSFCERCISSHITDNLKSFITTNGLDCPICKKPTTQPGFIGQKPEVWSTMLPTNQALSNILKALKTVKSKSDLLCPRHKDQEVEFFCEEHEIFACSLCSTHSHKACRSVPTISDAVDKRLANIGTLTNDLSAQITQTETILNNRQDQMDLLESREEDIKQKIADMKTQFNDFFSQMEVKILDKMAETKHSEFGLIQFVINQCHNIMTRANEAIKQINDLKEDKNLMNVVETYNTELKAYEERQDNVDQLLEKLLDIKVNYLANRDIEKTLYEANSIGSLSIERVRSSIAKPVQQETVKPRSKTAKLKVIQKDAGEVKKQISRNTSRSRHSKTDVALDKRMKNISAFPVSVGTSAGESSEVTVPRLKLEEVKVKDSETSRRDTAIMAKARFTREFNAAADKETGCIIEGVAILPSGHIVVTDSFNNCLKLFDTSFKFVTMTKFTISPGDLTTINEKEVVVCLPETQKLKHVKIDLKSKKITAGEILNVGDKCFSLSFSNRKLACCSSSSVYIFQRQGSVWCLEATINMHVNNLKFVALDSTAEKFVVTRDGYPNRSIICTSISGAKLWAFTHEEIRLPRGITFYGNKILVAVSDQKTIIQLNSKDGRLDGIIVQGNGLQWPSKLCVNQRGDQMLLSQNHLNMTAKDKNKVLMFRLVKTQIQEKDESAT